ncbi:MAG: 2-oxoglutarate dehydrogenase, E2 component, dihydrolipoamide succinyltransferase, partial [Calditrichaeota bacterium]
MAKVNMVMPQMGESIAEGTIIKWLKKEGEKVERDEIILEISTDKVDSEIPSPHTGIVKKLLAKEGETVKVGSVIAELETEGEAAAAEEKPAAPSAPAEAPAASQPAPQVTAPPPPPVAEPSTQLASQPAGDHVGVATM